MSNEQAIAESTTKVYPSNIGVIAQSTGFKVVTTSGEWVQNSEQIIEQLSRIKNLNTRAHRAGVGCAAPPPTQPLSRLCRIYSSPQGSSPTKTVAPSALVPKPEPVVCFLQGNV